jgi:hypothetical protein
MGLGQTIQRSSQIGHLGMPGWETVNPRSAQDRAQDFNPAGAGTPEEALAYIRLFSEAGRTAELAALLRSSPVFREAWQTLQRFSSVGPEAGLDKSPALPNGPDTRQPSPLPSPADAGSQSQGPTALQVAAASGGSGENPATQAYLVISSRPSRSLAAARQAYETTDRLLPREGGASPRHISVRV